jgi:transglutaminase-like putative cysteine protease
VDRQRPRRRAREERLVNARFLLRPNALVLIRLAPAAAASLLLAVTAATTQLPALARGIAIALVVASVLVAFVPKRNDVKTHGSVTAAVLAVAATGQTRTGPEYLVGAALFALLVLACLRAPLVEARLRAATSTGATAPAEADRWRVGPLAILVIVTGAITASLLVMLPRLSAIVEREVQRLAGNVAADDDQVGFDTRLRIGSLRHMLQGNRVVMRITGERVDYLRGAVLDHYESRIWSSTQSTTEAVTASAPEELSTTTIELSRAALSGRAADPRWFLPEDACDLHTPTGRLALDPHGTAHPLPPNESREISFRRAGGGHCTSPPAPRLLPQRSDVGIAPKIREELAPIALAWTRDATTQRGALEAIVRELSRYPYSLADRREGRLDPVVEFLQKHEGGHCELFASAMALLARSLGIPTRIAVGYRVGEVNAITGASVVRDRNAHTWVEAFIEGRWQTFDPTPPVELMASSRPTRWEHASEALSFAFDRTIGFFVNIGLARAGIFSGVMAVVLIVVRSFVQRRAAAASRSTSGPTPLPAFESLATALSRAGWERVPSEPLERFAKRVDAAGEPWSREVAEALARYAALRYGGIGEERTVASRLDELARKLTPLGP